MAFVTWKHKFNILLKTNLFASLDASDRHVLNKLGMPKYHDTVTPFMRSVVAIDMLRRNPMLQYMNVPWYLELTESQDEETRQERAERAVTIMNADIARFNLPFGDARNPIYVEPLAKGGVDYLSLEELIKPGVKLEAYYERLHFAFLNPRFVGPKEFRELMLPKRRDVEGVLKAPAFMRN